MSTVIIEDMVVNWIVRVMKGGMGFMTENKRFIIVKSKLVENGWVIDDKCKEFVFHTIVGNKRGLITYCKILNSFQDKVDGMELRFKREMYGDFSYD